MKAKPRFGSRGKFKAVAFIPANIIDCGSQSWRLSLLLTKATMLFTNCDFFSLNTLAR